MGGDDPALQPSPSCSSSSMMWSSAGSSPSVIQFVSNVDTLAAASLSACPSTGSSLCGSLSDIEIELLFHQGAAADDDDCSSTWPAFHRSSSLRGCSDDDGEQDLEAGCSGLLRTSSLTTAADEFVERDGTGELRWSALEGFRPSSSMSPRSATG
jgi:hypothetical protein